MHRIYALDLAHDATVGERSRNSKFSMHHQDQSMERLATRERGVHIHTLEDRDVEALQECDRWSRTRSDSNRGRIRSKHRTTAPPRSTHVQPGDVSHALIQQGERERLGKTSSSSNTTAWWWWRSVALQQGFGKHCERRGGRGVGLRQERGRLVSLAAPPNPHYI